MDETPPPDGGSMRKDSKDAGLESCGEVREPTHPVSNGSSRMEKRSRRVLVQHVRDGNYS